MCDTCGCGDPNIVPVDVHDSLLAGNDRMAAHNREHFRERARGRRESDGIARRGQDGRPRGDGAATRRAAAARGARR